MTFKELRIFGPPGTGKTTEITKLVAQAVAHVGPENVLVSSFTKTAAKVLGGVDLSGVDAKTLHAHCWHGLDQPKIASRCIKKAPASWEGITPWNDAYPQYLLSSEGSKDDFDDAYGEPADEGADGLLAEMQRHRAMLTPREAWADPEVVWFAERWEDWKAQQELVDFNDLIDLAITNLPYAPGMPAIGLFDEAQDFSPQQLKLIRSWAQFMEHITLCGDDDQVLYEWAGCTPQAFLEPAVPEDRMRILTQSYRVPHAVHARAQKWVEQISYRQPKAYLPRPADGKVIRAGATYRHPEAVVLDAQRRMQEGQSVMFLTTCSYMLDPIIAMLREAGVPYHNQYREKAGKWNPLRSVGGTTSADRLLLFARPDEAIWGEDARQWTYKELLTWTEPLRATGVLKHGAKAAIKEKKGEPGQVPWGQLAEWFEESALNHLYDTDMEWYARNVLDRYHKALQFPLRVLATQGPDGLKKRPICTVGTIHSVKGGEASCVYVFPDMSNRGYYGNWLGSRAEQDSVRRLFYVALTRARDTLILCAPATHLAVEGL